MNDRDKIENYFKIYFDEKKEPSPPFLNSEILERRKQERDMRAQIILVSVVSALWSMLLVLFLCWIGRVYQVTGLFLSLAALSGVFGTGILALLLFVMKRRGRPTGF